jgi:hypothetical protein
MDDVFRREAAWRIRTPIDKAQFRSMLPVFSLRPSSASRTADGGLHPYCDSPSSSPVLPERRLQASIVTPPSRCPLAPPPRQPRPIGSAGRAGEIAVNLHPSQRASRVPPPQGGRTSPIRRVFGNVRHRGTYVAVAVDHDVDVELYAVRHVDLGLPDASPEIDGTSENQYLPERVGLPHRLQGRRVDDIGASGGRRRDSRDCRDLWARGVARADAQKYENRRRTASGGGDVGFHQYCHLCSSSLCVLKTMLQASPIVTPTQYKTSGSHRLRAPRSRRSDRRSPITMATPGEMALHGSDTI